MIYGAILRLAARNARSVQIDHVRIGMTFYRPRDRQLSDNLAKASRQHDAIIDAIAQGDEATAAGLAHEHWALSRDQIEMFVMPAELDQPLPGHLGPPA